MWASALLHEVLSELKDTCSKDDKVIHWQVFEKRFLSPILDGADAVSLEELRRQHGLSDEKQVSNMAITIKRRFSAMMRQRVRQWVDSDEEVDSEISDLMQILSNHGAA